MTTINLSQESNRFIEDLRVYFYSSGKKESEIREIIEELEVHLFEAEANGKSIEQVVGNSPKLYMESISKEMKTDHRGWLKIIPIIFLGGLSYSILGDLLSQGTLSYSILLLVGLVLNFLLFFFGVALSFRISAKNSFRKTTELLCLAGPILVSVLFFVAILLMDRRYVTPVIEFGTAASLFIGFGFVLFLIALSIWSKTIIIPLTLLALYLPSELLKQTSLSEQTQLISSMLLTYGIIGGYLLLFFLKEKKKENEPV